MTRIYDAFLFGGELDMLECRLYELQDAPVYKHVIVEASETFTGQPKPLVFAENAARYARWADRIRYVPVVFPADLGHPEGWMGDHQGPAWMREHYSRNAIRLGLDDAAPDDVVFMSDVDEIPPAWAVVNPPVPSVLVMRLMCFAVDWECPWTDWQGTVIQRYGDIGSFARQRGGAGFPAVAGGWHMSWLGGPQAMRDKVTAFSHTEAVTMILQGIAEGKFYERGVLWNHAGRHDVQFTGADVDETWPRWVAERKCPQSWFRPR